MVLSKISSVVLETSQKMFVDNSFAREILRIDPTGKYAVLRGVATMAALSGVLISSSYLYYKGELTREMSGVSFSEVMEAFVACAGVIEPKIVGPSCLSNKINGLQKSSSDLVKTKPVSRIQILKRDLDTVLESGRALVGEVEQEGGKGSEEMVRCIEKQMEKFSEQYSKIAAKYSLGT